LTLKAKPHELRSKKLGESLSTNPEILFVWRLGRPVPSIRHSLSKMLTYVTYYTGAKSKEIAKKNSESVKEIAEKDVRKAKRTAEKIKVTHCLQ